MLDSRLNKLDQRQEDTIVIQTQNGEHLNRIRGTAMEMQRWDEDTERTAGLGNSI